MFSNTKSTCATNNVAASALTFESIIKAISLLPKDPIKEFMIEKNCNPDDGWILIIPSYLREKFEYNPPYLKFSQFVNEPMLINPKILNEEF